MVTDPPKTGNPETFVRRRDLCSSQKVDLLRVRSTRSCSIGVRYQVKVLVSHRLVWPSLEMQEPVLFLHGAICRSGSFWHSSRRQA